MSEVVLEAVGLNGQISLLTDRVVIKRKGVMGFLSQGLKGDKETPIRNITSVQMKEAGMLTNGYIHESRGGLMDATTDENSVVFNKKQMDQFVAFKQKLDSLMTAAHAAPAVTVQSAISPAEEIGKLAALRDQGILTQQEFDETKRQLLCL